MDQEVTLLQLAKRMEQQANLLSKVRLKNYACSGWSGCNTRGNELVKTLRGKLGCLRV